MASTPDDAKVASAITAAASSGASKPIADAGPLGAASTWVTSVAVLGATIAGVAGAVLPDAGSIVKSASYGTAALLAMVVAVRLYRAKRTGTPSSTNITPGATALLRGLLPFEDGDQLVGRNTDTQGIVTIILSSNFRFGVVWGASGCGKTSILQAGLPRPLRQAGLRVAYVDGPRLDRCKAAVERLDGATDLAVPETERKVGPERVQELLIIDQFEELFVEQTSRLRLDAVKGWLAEWLGVAGTRRAVVIGVREDFFARLQHLSPEIPDPTSIRTCYELPNLTAANAREVLRASVARDGAHFTEELIDAILADLESEGSVRAADLQLVATQLKRKDVSALSTYAALGRAKGILGSYIKSELQRAGDQILAARILRLLCSEDFLTKQPKAQTIQELVTTLGQLGTSPSVDAVGAVLRQFVASRIVLVVDDESYSLVHDYFAPLIASATYDKRDAREHANLLLRRYLSQFKYNDGIRVPFVDLLTITRRASPLLRGSPSARALLRASWRSAALRVIVPSLAFVLVPVGLAYALLGASYYLSTSQGERKRDDAAIVVRSGVPALKVLPGFDEVVVRTDYGMDAFDAEDQVAKDAFPREQLTGFWIHRPDGYHGWLDQLATSLPPGDRATLYRLVGRRVLSRDLLVAAMLAAKDGHGTDLAARFGVLSLAEPGAVDASIVAPLLELRKNGGRVALNADIGLAELKLNGAKLPEGSNVALKTQLDILKGRMKERPEPDVSSSVQPDMRAVTAMIRVAPESVDAEALDVALSIVSDETLDVFSRLSFLRVLRSLSMVSEVAAERVVTGLLAELEKLVRESGWYGDAIYSMVIDVASTYPSIVTRQLLKFIGDAILRAPDERSYFHVPLYSHLARLNPAVVDADVVRAVQAVWWRATPDQKRELVVPVVRLGLLDGRWVPDDAFASLREEAARRNQKKGAMYEKEGPMHEAQMLLLELLERQQPSSRRSGELRKLVDQSVALFISGSQSRAFGPIPLSTILRRAERLESGAISQTNAMTLLDLTVESRIYGRADQAAEVILSISSIAPGVIADAKEHVDKVVDRQNPFGNKERPRILTDAALAAARYHVLKRSQPAQLEEKLWPDLISAGDRRARAAAEVGLFLLATEDGVASKRLVQRARDLAADARPVHRISGTRLIEMIRLADALRDAKNDSRKVPRLDDRLREIEDEFRHLIGDEHLRVAAALARIELDARRY